MKSSQSSTSIQKGSIQKSLLVKNCGKVVSAKIQERQWPPTPQDILEEKNINTSNNTLLNLIASIVCPNSTLDENGTVKLSKVKATKVSKICDNIETLIANAKLSLSQVLLSLNIYRKTCSSEVITDLHRIGHGLSYTETKFIEDKWTEWSENQSKLVPNNIDEDSIVTHVADNIDWKNKTFNGEETHNTNSIFIQENTVLKDRERKGIVLQPDYDFDGKTHHSYKGVTTTLDTINFVRGKCKLLEEKEIHDNTEYEKSSTENFAWGLTRYAASDRCSQIVPSWTGFQKLIYPNKNAKVSVGYLDPITAPPTEMKVIFSVINRSMDVMTELNLKNILEVDQAIYTKILDVMFRMELDG